MRDFKATDCWIKLELFIQFTIKEADFGLIFCKRNEDEDGDTQGQVTHQSHSLQETCRRHSLSNHRGRD